MASIYVGASETLVLDAELLTLRADKSECLVRLVCSAWMARSWTLQEGLLPPSCRIIFSNRALRFQSGVTWTPRNVEERIADIDEDVESQMGADIQAYMGNFFSDLKTFVHWRKGYDRLGQRSVEAAVDPRIDPFKITAAVDMSHSAKAFVSLWNRMSARSTTKKDDLHLIMANLLHLDCTPLLDPLAAKERLPTILFGLDQLPLQLLFNTGRRLDSNVYPLNNWVPLDLNSEFLGESGILEFLDVTSVSTRPLMALYIAPSVKVHAVLIDDLSLSEMDTRGFIMTGSWGGNALVAPIVTRQRSKARSDSMSTICIIYDKAIAREGRARSHPGAIFSVAAHKSSGFDVQLYLHFVCPANVSFDTPPDNSKHIYSATNIYVHDSSIRIFIEYSTYTRYSQVRFI